MFRDLGVRISSHILTDSRGPLGRPPAELRPDAALLAGPPAALREGARPFRSASAVEANSLQILYKFFFSSSHRKLVPSLCSTSILVFCGFCATGLTQHYDYRRGLLGIETRAFAFPVSHILGWLLLVFVLHIRLSSFPPWLQPCKNSNTH